VNDNVGNTVRTFYDEVGWETDGGITEDAKRFEDLRECARDYVSKCRLRVLRHIPPGGLNILDVASGPIQFKEYLEYSKNFSKRYCVDLSSKALSAAKEKIGDHGVFLHGDLLDLHLDENFFDCSISLHTIYHIDKDVQEQAVRKLVRVTRPGHPVVIVYSNPNTLFRRIYRPFLFARTIQRKLKALLQKQTEATGPKLYFHPHPLEWWNRFSDIADVRILPWRSFASNHQALLIPNGSLGRKMFEYLFGLEDRFPAFFAKHFQYPMIILTKRRS
jgi:ubiquinone/menaquinone biosynthesis C-methylase UbiE